MNLTLSVLQHSIMTYLDVNGITTCTPVKTTSGSTSCTVNLHGDTNNGRNMHHNYVCIKLCMVPKRSIDFNNYRKDSQTEYIF
jgi:hypothetical protein